MSEVVDLSRSDRPLTFETQHVWQPISGLARPARTQLRIVTPAPHSAVAAIWDRARDWRTGTERVVGVNFTCLEGRAAGWGVKRQAGRQQQLG